MEHVVGLNGLTELLSKRCLGAAKQTTAGPSRQASPLTVAELQVPHDVLASPDGDIWDRNMAGAFWDAYIQGQGGRIFNTQMR